MKNELAKEDEGYDFIKKVMDGTMKLGDGISCELDKYLRYKSGQFNVIVGHANVGKTAWIVFYFVSLAVHHDKKFLIYSSENTIGSLKRRIMEFFMNRPVTDFTPNDLQKAKSFVRRHFDFLRTDRTYTAEELMSAAKAVHEYSKYDAMVIDPYNSLRVPRNVGNSHDYHYEIAHEMRLFCKLHNVSIYICAHAVTEALRKVHRSEHEFANHPMPPGSSDIEGGGKWVNRADDFIVIHRYTQHPMRWMETHINIRKVKEQETGGKPTFIDEPVVFVMKRGCSFTCYDMDPIQRGIKNYEQRIIDSSKLPF